MPYVVGSVKSLACNQTSDRRFSGRPTSDCNATDVRRIPTNSLLSAPYANSQYRTSDTRPTPYCSPTHLRPDRPFSDSQRLHYCLVLTRVRSIFIGRRFLLSRRDRSPYRHTPYPCPLSTSLLVRSYLISTSI